MTGRPGNPDESQYETEDVRARPTGRALRRVLAVGLFTMLTSPVLIVWEVNVLVVMSLVVLIRPAWRARTYVLRWGMLLGVLPYLLLWLVQVAFFGSGDDPTSGLGSSNSTTPSPTSVVGSSG